MPIIFTRYGSWMVTGLTLALSMVTAAMTIAFGATPFWVTGEDELLEFTVTSGELVICRLLRGFRLLYSIAVNGNRISLTIVLHIKSLSGIDSPPHSPIPEEQDPSLLHPPLFVKNDENTFLPGIPFQLRCPLCPHLLETGETCFHSDRGIKILRRSPEDVPSGNNILDRPFEFLRITSEDTLQEREVFNHSAFLSAHPGRTFYPHHPSPLGSPSIPTQIEEAVRTVITQETLTPPPIPSFDSSHTHLIHRDSPEPSSIPMRQLRQHRGNERGDNRPTRVTGRPNRGGRTPTVETRTSLCLYFTSFTFHPTALLLSIHSELPISC